MAPRSPSRALLDRDQHFGILEQTEDGCRCYLEALRWPDGVSCPRCEDRSVTEIPARRRYYCRSCRHFFSLTSGTAFHNSHLPLWKWLLTIELLLSTDDGVPANELMKVLGGSYKTAWFVEHRIRAAVGIARTRRHLPQGERRLAGERTYAPALVGRYHQLGLKYLPRYEAEKNWRARERSNPNAFRDTVVALLRAEPLSFRELVLSDSITAAPLSPATYRSSVVDEVSAADE